MCSVTAVWILWKQDNEAYSCFYSNKCRCELSVCVCKLAMCLLVLCVYDTAEYGHFSYLSPLLASG